MWVDLWQAFLSMISLKCLAPVLLDMAFWSLEIVAINRIKKGKEQSYIILAPAGANFPIAGPYYMLVECNEEIINHYRVLVKVAE